MKSTPKIIAALFFCLFVHLSVIAQPPPEPPSHPFPTLKAIWSELMGDKYGMEGDTLINNKTYKKIYTSQDSIFDFGSAGYYAALREFPDGIIKTIINGENQERQLYNFALLEGQSTTVWSKDHGDVNVTFIGIDSIDLVYEQRYVFRYSVQGSTNQFEWIEGVGSKTGLFYPAFATSIGPERSLICFDENDSLKYLNPLYSDCYGQLVGVEQNTLSPLKLYPNPTSSSLYIESPQELQNVAIELSDLLGNVVYYTRLGNGFRFEVNNVTLAQGAYAYRISNDGIVISSGKLIFH